MNKALLNIGKEAAVQRSNRVEVLDKVKEIVNFSNDGYISINKVAELYKVEETEVSSLLGIAVELREEINLLVSKMDMLNVGFMLTESEVAQELRRQVTNIRDVV